MAASREQMMDLIRVKYPKLFMRTTEEFDGSKNGIWSSAESGVKAKDGFDLFDYYGEGNRYNLGVHNDIGNLLEKNGWYAEWYDSGTIMFYLN